MYIGKHLKVSSEVEYYNLEMEAHRALWKEEMTNYGFNPERVAAWNEEVEYMRKLRRDLIEVLYEKGERHSVLNFQGSYEMLGPEKPLFTDLGFLNMDFIAW